ncbi:MAG: CinA family nicotinamide mononucleotide deamidase-related protein [Planctomycetota bacterium]|nr:CinA family nicotinamide mononucleotide deamidase-related protein [Planctomycetota bacterium]
MSISACVVTTGEELLFGTTLDTNGTELSRRLLSLGVHTKLRLTVGDKMADITNAIKQGLQEADIVVVTGGLGPTDDDTTRESIAHLLNLSLERDYEAESHLKDVLSKVKVSIGESELKQAKVPERSIVIPNRHGTAAGFALEVCVEGSSKLIFALSGVPFEMRQMFEDSVAPLIEQKFAGRLHPLSIRRINTIGYSESEVQGLVHSLKIPDTVSVAYKASDYIVSVMFYSEEEKEVERTAESFRQLLDRRKFLSEGDVSIQEALLAALKTGKGTFAIAESFTGGLIMDRVTSVPGISEFFKGGVVAYAADSKTALLGVSEKTIREKRLYSEEVALEMARGVKRLFGADFSVATTGVAGPADVSPDAPAGLCVVAVCGKSSEYVKRFRIPGDRQTVKSRASNIAINLLRLAFLSL